MISQFPDFYPDEVMYSVLARYYVRSGHLAFRYCSEDLFKRTTHPDIEYFNDLSDDVRSLIDIDDVILNHTMFPLNARFVSSERRKKAFISLETGTTEYQNLLYRPRGKSGVTRYLRYCPFCAQEDRKFYGEAYWHREHQMPGLIVCQKHGCYLTDTDISINCKTSPSLYACDVVIPTTLDSRRCTDELELKVGAYYQKVCMSSIEMDKEYNIGAFFKSVLQNTKYSTPRGEQIYFDNLYNDLQVFYGDISNNMIDERWQIMVSNLAIRPFNLSKDDLLRINNYLDEDDGIQRAIKSLIKNTYFY